MKKQQKTHTAITIDKSRRINFRSRLCLTLLSLLIPGAALLAQVTTIARLRPNPNGPFFKVVPAPTDSLFVSAVGTTSGKMSFLKFDLTSIPASVTVVSASLRLTLAADPSDRTSVVIYRVMNDNLEAPVLSDKQIAAHSILAEDYKKNSTVVFEDLPVDHLQQALERRALTIRLSTTFRNGNAVFYSSELKTFPPYEQDPVFIPRLVITYKPEPAPLAWGAFHADAQHTAMSPAIFSGSVPVQSAVKQAVQFNNNIQKNMLLYKDKMYVVAQSGASTCNLYMVDPLTQTMSEVRSGLSLPQEMGAIDPYGRYYHVGDNLITIINLEGGNSIRVPIDITKKLVTAPPTLGPDGTLYLATSLYIYAYTPFPRHELLWQYAVPSQSMSSATLSHDGMTAYVVFGDPLKLVAINTITGQGRTLLLDNTPGAGKNGKMVPVINNQGQLFVTDDYPLANTLYVINKSMAVDTVIRGTKISQPVVRGDGTVYYGANGSLMSYTNKNNVSEVVKDIGAIVNMITDAGNNVYCWNTDNRLRGFDKNGILFLDITKPLGNFSREWDMTLAKDGSLYTGTSTKIYGIRPVAFAPAGYSLSNSDLSTNNRTFRAGVLTINPGINFEKGYSPVLTGSTSIVMSNTLKPGSSTQLVSGGTIVFKPGFKVETGAELSCKTGY